MFTDPPPAKVGEVAPVASLMDSKGNEVDLSKVFGKWPTVIVVYRGVW